MVNSGKTLAGVQTLIIHPGKNLTEGHRYIVALRHLRGADGSVIPASAAFRAYRDGTATDPRATRMNSIFRMLGKAGIARGDLNLAWDFTVASERNLSERMLHIRNDAFAQLGDNDLADVRVQGSAPVAKVYPDQPDNTVPSSPSQANVDGITEFAPCDPGGCQAGQSNRLLRIVRGRVVVPCYLSTPECAPGGSFVYGLDGLPIENPTTRSLADFVCIVPRSVLTRGPARPALYGHGLLGDACQVAGGPQQDLANEQNIILCATDWIGMATEDLPNAVRDPRRRLALRLAGRPRPAGDAQLHVPRAGADPPAGAVDRPGLPGRRQERRRHAATSTTTAAARAGSWAAR